MVPFDTVLAVALLTAAPSSPAPAGIQDMFPVLRGPLQALALRWEILDRTLGGTTVPGTDRFEMVRRPPDPGK